MRIEKHLTLEAIPARVYNAFTHPEELTRWFCDLADFNLQKGAEVDFAWKIKEAAGEETLHPKVLRCEVEDFVHCKELDMACRYGPEQSEIKITLRPQGLKTELTVIHEGIEDPERLCKTEGYWDQNLERLKSYIEQH